MAKKHSSLFLLALSMLLIARGGLFCAGAKKDASDIFSEATAGIVDDADEFSGLSPEDQAILDGFFEPEPIEQDFFGDDSKETYGLANEFKISGPGSLERLSYPGIGTYGYGMSPISSYGAVNYACGLGYVDEYFQSRYVGVGSSLFGQGKACGRCVRLQCDDISCEEPGKQIVAQVVDLCGECFDGDLNIPGPVFKELAGRNPNPNPSLAMSWEFGDCSDFIDTTIKMLVKPDGSAYFQAFNFANARQPIIAAQANGDLLKHESNNFWTWYPSKGPINPRVRMHF